jgi:hypothetical protein
VVAKPAEGQQQPAEGQQQPDEGQAKPAEGQAKPAEGQQEQVTPTEQLVVVQPPLQGEVLSEEDAILDRKWDWGEIQPGAKLTPEQRHAYEVGIRCIGRNEYSTARWIAFWQLHKLWQSEFDSFRQFINCVFAKSVDWAYQQLRWKRRYELLRGRNLPVEVLKQFGPTYSDLLGSTLDKEPDALLGAVLRFQLLCKEHPKVKDKSKLAKQAKDYALDYIRDRDDLNLAPPLAFGEWHVLQRLPASTVGQRPLLKDVSTLPDHATLGQKQALIKVMEQTKCLPEPEELLSLARGQDLVDLVNALQPVAQRIVQEREDEAAAAEMDAKHKREKDELQARIAKRKQDAEGKKQEEADEGQEQADEGQEQPDEGQAADAQPADAQEQPAEGQEQPAEGQPAEEGEEAAEEQAYLVHLYVTATITCTPEEMQHVVDGLDDGELQAAGSVTVTGRVVYDLEVVEASVEEYKEDDECDEDDEDE